MAQARPTISEPMPLTQIGQQRFWIALILTGTLPVVVVSFIFIWAFGPREPSVGAKDFFPIVISAMTGLVGAVVGYYFRAEERS